MTEIVKVNEKIGALEAQLKDKQNQLSEARVAMLGVIDFLYTK